MDPEIIILIDMSNSMKGKAEEDAKKVMPYSLVWINKHSGCKMLIFSYPSVLTCVLVFKKV